MKSIDDVVSAGLCISCGACCVASTNSETILKEVSNAGMLHPLPARPSEWGRGLEFDVCPGKGYDISRMGRTLFPGAPRTDVEFGRWVGHWAARSLDDKILASASSGGIMTAIADHLLASNSIKGVVATRLTYTDSGPRAEPFIAENTQDLISAQGSKYCPVSTVEIVREIRTFGGQVLFIGTPCQIAGLRLLQTQSSWLREKVPLTMGNYCGGFRDFRETDKIIQRAGFDRRDVTRFRYRGGGQPGSMLIEDIKGRSAELPYPGYARMTGIVKNKRCRLCVDATAELADFSCGDAWVPRFLESGKAWSIVMSRSDKANRVLDEMVKAKKIELTDISLDEVKLSQKGNLASKKGRQYARRKLYRFLRIEMPEFDGGFKVSRGGLMLELRVLLTHSLFAAMERLRLYPLIAKAIRRYPKGT